MSALREQFSLLREFLRGGYLRTVRNCALAMAAAVFLGYWIAVSAPEQMDAVLDAFQRKILESGVMDETGNVSVFALLLHNWQAMLLSAAYGFIPFVFLPLVSLFSNGALMGILAGYYRMNGLSMSLYLAGVLPHGVFELSALVLTIACGIRLCRNMCDIILGSPRRMPMVDLLSDLLRVELLIVLPLTVVAALVECYVTPLVMGLFM